MSETVNFIQGSKKNYDSSTMQGGVYFSKDSKEILLNGESYGNAVPADEEDITAASGSLKLKDREVDADNFLSKGYIILRKNIVDGKNILTQEMINQPNTTYEIKYDFDLNEELLILSENTTLYFNGGCLRNGVIYLNECTIQSKFAGAIFIDILFRTERYGSHTNTCKNVLYDYYFEDTLRDDDYLKLYNLVHGNPGVITSKVLNIKALKNPYYDKYKDKGVHAGIFTHTLNLEGNDTTVNILADLGTEDRPFKSHDMYGINAVDLITANNTNCSISVKNISFVDDNSINNKGADFSKTEYTYDGVTDTVRGHIISASFQKLLDLTFDNVNSRSAYQLFGTNSWGEEPEDKISPINILFRNVNVYSHTNFCLEIWGKTLSALSVSYVNCTFDNKNYCLISNSALADTFAIYKNCTFGGSYLSEVGSYRCENCLFLNSQYIYTTVDIKVEIIGCKFIINEKISGTRGGYFWLISKDCKLIDNIFEIDKINYVNFIISDYDNDTEYIKEKKVLIKNTKLPLNANYSIDKDFLNSFDELIIEDMFHEIVFNSNNSYFENKFININARYVNCGYVFDKYLTERAYSRDRDYLNYFASHFPIVYNNNIEDDNKVILDNYIVKSIKDISIDFKGVTTFNKFLTARIGFINSGAGSITFNADKNIRVIIDTDHISLNVCGKTTLYYFPTIEYREIAVSIDLEKQLIYLFVNGEFCLGTNFTGSFTDTTVTLDGNVSLNVTGCQLRYVMFQPICLMKNYF